MQPPDKVREIQMAMIGGEEHLLKQLPYMILGAINAKIWTTYTSGLEGRPWGTFEAWVTHPLWEGLECTVEELLFFCRHEPEIQERIRAELSPVAKHGEIGGGHAEGRGDVVPSAQRGNSATHALRRLKRDRPDLAERVVRGELSAHAAAIEAGFRGKTWTAPSDPQKLAEAILRRYPQDVVVELCRFLAQ